MPREAGLLCTVDDDERRAGGAEDDRCQTGTDSGDVEMAGQVAQAGQEAGSAFDEAVASGGQRVW